MISFNTLGSLTLILSTIVVVISILLSWFGLSKKIQFQLVRSFLLEWIEDTFFNKIPIKRRLSRKIYKFFFSVNFYLSGKAIKFVNLSKFRLLAISRQALITNFFLSLIAYVILLIQLWINDLSSKYVVNYSSDSLSIFYRLTASWAGSSGSLLFWYFILNLLSFVYITTSRQRLILQWSVSILIMGFLQLLFISLMIFFTDAQPFLEYILPMKAGRGLNPLLLHWAMIIHPPILYIGYVSFAIPFMILVSAVISGKQDSILSLIRKWSLFAWFFLGFGILLGSLWAYEELGWGGFWAWDPVENASLMPFILATAFLHSLLVQQHRGMLKFWNLLLIILTYHFCLLGTWITRSGVIEGPHSFAKSNIGYPLIIFILLSLMYFLRFLYFKRKALKPEEKLESVTSKEASIILNNFLMFVSVLIVLFGVFSPLIPYHCSFDNSGFHCFPSEWKPNSYNKIMVPIGIMILFLMGVSPLLAWRKPFNKVYLKTIKKPLGIGITGTVIYFFIYFVYLKPYLNFNNSPWGFQIIADLFSILTVGIGIFVVAGIIQEFIHGMRSRKLRMGESYFLAFKNLILRNQRRYGGYLVHLSVVFLFIGYSGTAFKTEYQLQFHYYLLKAPSDSKYIYYYSGDKAYIQNYVIEARELFIRPHFEPNADQTNPIYMTVSSEAHFRINPQQFQPVVTVSYSDPYEMANQRNIEDKIIKFFTGFISDGKMKTERRFYPQVYPYTGTLIQNQIGFGERLITSEPDIKSNLTEDIYIQVGTIFDPIRNRNPDIASMFEYYFYDLKQSKDAYSIFPSSIVVDLHVWINPLMKFIWLGTILFFFSGLLVFLPLNNKEN